ncbi:2Fe-2S iron-sulfur cluster-binding protein [Brevibacillus reuszeri]|uniref:2Fe-2S iron-sulfur cluster-binding protein n=1 Tax=Brevibacillus reuszeri TaxID=54915 RepID=UPI000CCC9992|nr:2Fe-2S iron-sulfur cluster binding domain-containing protein [Brevibacillus reuszeri]
MRKQLTVGSLLPTRPSVQTASPVPASKEPVPQTQTAFTRSTPPVRPGKTDLNQVQVKQKGQSFSVRYAPCQTLLAAALAQGQNIAYKCQQGSCGKCSVQVLHGDFLLDAPGVQEKTTLDKKLASGYRLACQSTFRSTRRM